MRRPTLQNGDRFGMLVVLRFADIQSGHRRYLCACDCGQEKIILSGSLKTGVSQSCGCLQRALTSKRNTKHGHTIGGVRSREHNAWHQMVQRCTNLNYKRYAEWGGRGIKVCERWLVFENFLADMGLSPSSKHSIDRYPNNDGNYEPGNCRWATMKEQCNNKNNNHLLTHGGRTQTVTQWAEEIGIKRSIIFERVHSGWSTELALMTPVLLGQKVIRR